MIQVPNPLPSWLTVEISPLFPKYECVRVEYVSIDDPRNNGSTNIYIKTLDKNGAYQEGIKVYQAFPSDVAEARTRKFGELDFNGEAFGVAFPMSGDSSFAPDRGEHGPYWCYAQTPSDIVRGMGVPLRRHVQFLLVYQWVDQTPPPPPPPPTEKKWVITSQSPLTLDGPNTIVFQYK